MAQFSNFLTSLMSNCIIDQLLHQKQQSTLSNFAHALFNCLKKSINASSNEFNSFVIWKLLQNSQFYFKDCLIQTTKMHNFNSEDLKHIGQSNIHLQFTQAQYCVGELVFRLILVKSLKNETESNNDKILDKSILIKNIQKILQKLRFEIQIDNMNKMNEQNFIVFDDLLQEIFTIFIKQKSQEYLKSCTLFYQAMKQQSSNVSDHLVDKLKIILQKEASSCKISKNLVNSQQKNRIDFLLQKKIQIQQKQAFKKFTQSQNKKQNQFYISTFKKEKPIQKSRTIYHSRKNMFIPRKKIENIFQKSESIDQSTQWSSTLSKFRRSVRDINQDFEQDALVQKTPKANKFYFSNLLNQKPIELRLDFFD